MCRTCVAILQLVNFCLPLFPAYNDKVVLFLRQQNVWEVLKVKQPSVSSSSKLKNKINAIRDHGVEMLERLRNDVELTILLR